MEKGAADLSCLPGATRKGCPPFLWGQVCVWRNVICAGFVKRRLDPYGEKPYRLFWMPLEAG